MVKQYPFRTGFDEKPCLFPGFCYRFGFYRGFMHLSRKNPLEKPTVNNMESGDSGILSTAITPSRILLGPIQSAGISVYGLGNIHITPDLAVLSIGVESRNLQVTHAKLEASNPMNRMVRVLKNGNIPNQDMMTQNFNISPQYNRVERFAADRSRYTEQVLIGYVVTSETTVRIKELTSFGRMVDDLSEATGKPDRIKGIRFTVENPEPYLVKARVLAMKNAIAKANQFASSAQVNLGDPVYIGENNASTLIPQTSRTEFGMVAMDSMPILPGEIEVSVEVHVIFSIR